MKPETKLLPLLPLLIFKSDKEIGFELLGISERSICFERSERSERRTSLKTP